MLLSRAVARGARCGAGVPKLALARARACSSAAAAPAQPSIVIEGVGEEETTEDKEEVSDTMRPREIVTQLDSYIVGQGDAKRAVAVAMRNRWRRQRVESPLREDIMPKNILMIGPTGVGKTEVARRLAKLANAPFLKVEATKFTEVGFVGKDVDQIIRDLMDCGMTIAKVTRPSPPQERPRPTDRRTDPLSDRLSSPPTHPPPHRPHL